MSWLARLEVDAKIARTERISDNYAWHKRLWECFPDEPVAKRDFLTRIDQIEGKFRLWMLAQRQPVRPQWCSLDDFAVKEIAASFLSHPFYAFDLRANPTKCLVQRDAHGVRKRNGKRIPLVKPDELRAWLERKGDAGGFSISADKPLEIGPMVENYFSKKGQAGYHGGVQFRGTLAVDDPARFTETYHSGIGSAKGFGFGLLLMAPINLQSL
jgi:CRISPR system Cascade subunit CasE